MQFYSAPFRESDPTSLPDCEVFWFEVVESEYDQEALFSASGFYWWYCFPGCLPDSDPIGPFDTEDQAIADARVW